MDAIRNIDSMHFHGVEGQRSVVFEKTPVGVLVIRRKEHCDQILQVLTKGNGVVPFTSEQTETLQTPNPPKGQFFLLLDTKVTDYIENLERLGVRVGREVSI